MNNEIKVHKELSCHKEDVEELPQSLQISGLEIQEFNSKAETNDTQKNHHVKSIQDAIKYAALTVTEVFFENLKERIKAIHVQDADPELLEAYKQHLSDLLEKVRTNFDSHLSLQRKSNSIEIKINPLNLDQIATLQALDILINALIEVQNHNLTINGNLSNIERKIEENENYINEKEILYTELIGPLEENKFSREAQKIERLISDAKRKISRQKKSRKYRSKKVESFPQIINEFLTNPENLEKLEKVIPEVHKLIHTLKINDFSNKEIDALLKPEEIELISRLMISIVKPKKPKVKPPKKSTPKMKPSVTEPAQPKESFFRRNLMQITILNIILCSLIAKLASDYFTPETEIATQEMTAPENPDPRSLKIKTTEKGWYPAPSSIVIPTSPDIKITRKTEEISEVTPQMRKLAEYSKPYTAEALPLLYAAEPETPEELYEFNNFRKSIEQSLAENAAKELNDGKISINGETMGYGLPEMGAEKIQAKFSDLQTDYHFMGRLDNGDDLYTVHRKARIHMHFVDIPEWCYDINIETQVTLQYPQKKDPNQPILKMEKVDEPDASMRPTVTPPLNPENQKLNEMFSKAEEMLKDPHADIEDVNQFLSKLEKEREKSLKKAALLGLKTTKEGTWSLEPKNIKILYENVEYERAVEENGKLNEAMITHLTKYIDKMPLSSQNYGDGIKGVQRLVEDSGGLDLLREIREKAIFLNVKIQLKNGRHFEKGTKNTKEIDGEVTFEIEFIDYSESQRFPHNSEAKIVVTRKGTVQVSHPTIPEWDFKVHFSFDIELEY